VIVLAAAWLVAQVQAIPCEMVRVPDDATFESFLVALAADTLDLDRVRRIERYTKHSAFTAEQAMRVLSLVGAPAQRQNAVTFVFPFIVDKENFGAVTERFFAAPPGWYALQPDRCDPRGERLLVGPYAAATGLLLPGGICIALMRISDADFARMKRAVSSEALSSRQVQALRRHLRDHLFSAAEAASLLQLVTYRDEKLEAGRLLRPRIVDPDVWNGTVCRALSDWFDCPLD
jgi:hypothetical protein